MLLRADWSYKGYVFVTGDASTYGFEHGHAGIGTNVTGSVIEANKGYEVKIYKDRVAGYWSKHNSSIMGVRNASSTNYNTAYVFANSKIGLPSNGLYCSELVFLAWQKAGFNLNGQGGMIVSPESLYVDADTYTIIKYGTGY